MILIFGRSFGHIFEFDIFVVLILSKISPQLMRFRKSNKYARFKATVVKIFQSLQFYLILVSFWPMISKTKIMKLQELNYRKVNGNFLRLGKTHFLRWRHLAEKFILISDWLAAASQQF